jgi:hypothetical protein
MFLLQKFRQGWTCGAGESGVIVKAQIVAAPLIQNPATQKGLENSWVRAEASMPSA